LSILHITLSYVVAAFRKTMVDDLVEAADGTNSSWFIDSCFTHCQTIFDTSGWNSAAAPRIGNKVRRRGCMWME
jgi:O-palmitoleoyl-L-serine hydrolase